MEGRELFQQVTSRPPWSEISPAIRRFMEDYLAAEKVIRFGEQWIINTILPPYPSRAFEGLGRGFLDSRPGGERPCSVSMAVTNRCKFRCWHCYNADRCQEDTPLEAIKRTAQELQDMGVVVVALTGGEPLLRHDLEDICRSFDDRSTLLMLTTGLGLSAERARRLKNSGLFGLSVSFDSDRPEEHDRLRGQSGAFRVAMCALAEARDAGLYPYVTTVARRELLDRDRFMGFLRFIGSMGALEVRLLEPVPVGRLRGQRGAAVTGRLRRMILQYQREAAGRADLPILSTSSYLGLPELFGCEAGARHIYIDGSGEVCPCNMIPLSFGNIAREPMQTILDRMHQHFPHARTSCAARWLADHVPPGPLPTKPDVSAAVCARHLPHGEDLPRLSRLLLDARGGVGLGRVHDISPERPGEACPGTYVSDEPETSKRRTRSSLDGRPGSAYGQTRRDGEG